jgi:DNA ligase-associated metallophosphoesterase
MQTGIRLAGHSLIPVAAGALFWPAEDTLIVADLHLEKGAAFAARGMMLPPYDTRSTLLRLAACIAAFEPTRVVVLGDSFHRSELASLIAPEDRETLYALQDGRNWFWVLGNHDPYLPASVGGLTCDEIIIRGVTLRHTPSPYETGPEIAGHLHPVARIARAGEGVRRKCFATDGNRVVMPAFGAYTGGLNVLDAAFSPLFRPHRLEAWMTGRARVYPIQARVLLPD